VTRGVEAERSIVSAALRLASVADVEDDAESPPPARQVGRKGPLLLLPLAAAAPAHTNSTRASYTYTGTAQWNRQGQGQGAHSEGEGAHIETHGRTGKRQGTPTGMRAGVRTCVQDAV
jgi:hypothetical protein